MQFDISYNPSEIKSVEPVAISGFEVKYNEISEGVIRGLIFSMQGQALPGNLNFEFGKMLRELDAISIKCSAFL